MRKFLRRLSDLPNAYRVLDIMDKAGCDIEEVITRNCSIYYRIKPKWWVSKKDAEDLRKIVLYKDIFSKQTFTAATFNFVKLAQKLVRVCFVRTFKLLYCIGN